jgi:hypothetical protein
MGVIWDFIVSMCEETFPPEPTFTLDDVPDLSGKVILMTGRIRLFLDKSFF